MALTDSQIRALIKSEVSRGIQEAKSHAKSCEAHARWQSQSHANMLVLTHTHCIADVDELANKLLAKVPWIGKKKVANLPSPPEGEVKGTMAYVPDESGGATMAFWDGTNWRRCTDLTIVS